MTYAKIRKENTVVTTTSKHCVLEQSENSNYNCKWSGNIPTKCMYFYYNRKTPSFNRSFFKSKKIKYLITFCYRSNFNEQDRKGNV